MVHAYFGKCRDEDGGRRNPIYELFDPSSTRRDCERRTDRNDLGRSIFAFHLMFVGSLFLSSCIRSGMVPCFVNSDMKHVNDKADSRKVNFDK